MLSVGIPHFFVILKGLPQNGIGTLLRGKLNYCPKFWCYIDPLKLTRQDRTEVKVQTHQLHTVSWPQITAGKELMLP